ncbi:hypothetical protein M0R45_023964 [Rubus argutus]|uniref:DUF4110 domain-containing protein n=1 Tax=Rubus argutus TaxID=59490 RepID=A0AAW1WRT8_RUBAR
MGKKAKKPGKGKEKTEKKTAKAEEKRACRETKKLSPEDDIDAILLNIQKEEAKKKEVHVEENVPAPSPRSNCTVMPTLVFVYNSVETWEWNKVKKSGMPPGPRAGFSMSVHKKRALLFGGVVDMEVQGDVMMSLFLDELYGFQLDNHRWYPLELRKGKSTKDKLKKSSGRKRYNDGDDKIDTTEQEESKANGKDENSEYDEEVGDSGSKIDCISQLMATTMTVDDSDIPEIVKPRGRINSCMVVGRDTLYVYGGMMEVKDQEVTLDDLYCLNLSKLDEWKCIIPASQSEWVEASEDEDEDEDEDDDDDDGDGDGDGDGDEDEDEDEDEETDDDNDGESGKGGSLQMGEAVALIKGGGKILRRKEKRARIEQIRASLGLSNSQGTPMPGESLRDFYKRTNMYWQMAAHEHTLHTGKLDTQELKPILDELPILEAEQKAEEQEAETSTSSRKRGKQR